MADNPQVRAGTVGGTITVAADEVTIYGGAAVLQGIKLHDGVEGGTVGARVSPTGELHTFQANNGTVTVSNTVPVSQITDPWNVYVTNGGTLLGQAGTVTALQGTTPWTVYTTNAGTVTVGAGGTLLGQAGTVTALQGTSPWVTVEQDATTGTLSSYTAAADGQVLASNSSRKRYSVYNEGDKDFLLGEGTTTVTTTVFTVRIPPLGYYASSDFTGQVRGLFVSALGSGRLQVTEVT